MKLKIHIKRVYEKPAAADGYRILVDRLWPRGLSKETAAFDLWEKRIAPSASLRRWFSHDPFLWHDFKMKYKAELRHSKVLTEMVALIKLKKIVTLLYAAKDREHAHAVILKACLEKLCGLEK